MSDDFTFFLVYSFLAFIALCNKIFADKYQKDILPEPNDNFHNDPRNIEIAQLKAENEILKQRTGYR